MTKVRKRREKKKILGQFTLRLYQGVLVDERIFQALDPLPVGLLRATMVQALHLGIASLRRQGWPFLETGAVKVATSKVTASPSLVLEQNKTEAKNPTAVYRSALQELMDE